jgi:hypothetical protein
MDSYYIDRPIDDPDFQDWMVKIGEGLKRVDSPLSPERFISKYLNVKALGFLHWYGREQEPPKGTRILVFSPDYPVSDMRLRFIDSQFWGTATDATMWAVVNEPV